MISDEEKKEITAAIKQVLREVEAELFERKRQSVTLREIEEEVLRRLANKEIPRLH